MSNQPRRRGPMGGGHGRMGTGEKAKDFKGTMKKLFTYLSLLPTKDVNITDFIKPASAIRGR